MSTEFRATSDTLGRKAAMPCESTDRLSGRLKNKYGENNEYNSPISEIGWELSHSRHRFLDEVNDSRRKLIHQGSLIRGSHLWAYPSVIRTYSDSGMNFQRCYLGKCHSVFNRQMPRSVRKMKTMLGMSRVLRARRYAGLSEPS